MSYTYNVMDEKYGAVGDGETDDTEAIQAAIDDAKDNLNGVYGGDDIENNENTKGVGGVVFFPKGETGDPRAYLTTAPLKLPPPSRSRVREPGP